MKRESISADSAADDGDNLARAAASWLRRREAGLTPVEAKELQAWLAMDRRHSAAFRRLDDTPSELDMPWHTGQVDELLTGLEVRAHQRRRRRRRAIGASVAAVGLFAVALSLQRPGEPDGAGALADTPQATLTVVQAARRILPDGSTVTLKESAGIRVEFADDARRVRLERGGAHFEVAKDAARPFIVSANGVDVRAVGTAFAVEIAPSTVEVLVTEGRVSVAAPAARVNGQDSSNRNDEPEMRAPRDPATRPSLFARAGERVVVDTRSASAPARLQAVPDAEIADRLAWRVPRLNFSGMPLLDVVTAVNQHRGESSGRFIIADAALATIRLSGALRLDRPEALIELLESDFHVQADRRTKGDVILRRAP
jgi:transmembrane sensor